MQSALHSKSGLPGNALHCGCYAKPWHPIANARQSQAKDAGLYFPTSHVLAHGYVPLRMAVSHGVAGIVGRHAHSIRMGFGHSDSDSVILGACLGDMLVRFGQWVRLFVRILYAGKLGARMPAVDRVGLND